MEVHSLGELGENADRGKRIKGCLSYQQVVNKGKDWDQQFSRPVHKVKHECNAI